MEQQSVEVVVGVVYMSAQVQQQEPLVAHSALQQDSLQLQPAADPELYSDALATPAQQPTDK